MAAIADTILRKINAASIFVADVTFVAMVPNNPKGLPNANVSLELGAAFHALRFERIVTVFNEHYGAYATMDFSRVPPQF